MVLLVENITLSNGGDSWGWCRRSTASSLLRLSSCRTAITEVSTILGKVRFNDTNSGRISINSSCHLKEYSLPVPALWARSLIGPWQCGVPSDISHNVCDLIHLKGEFGQCDTYTVLCFCCPENEKMGKRQNWLKCLPQSAKKFTSCMILLT